MKYTILTIFVWLPALLFGQRVVSISSIAGSYGMEDLKALQTRFEEEYRRRDIPVERVLDFPVSLQGEFGYSFEKGPRTYGTYLNYAMTKGKDHYSDYSGETLAQQKVSRILGGFKFSQKLIKDFRVYGKLGVSRSYLDLLFATYIHGGGSEEENLHYNSWGFNLEPGLSWEYPYQNFIFNVSGGYEITKQGSTYKKDSDDELLLNRNWEEVMINWNGFRLGLGVGYVF